MTAGSMVNRFAKAYRPLHLKRCSSHTGRRTFITRAGGGWCTGLAARYEMFNCSPATSRS
jgi:hypothetical protein